MGKRNRKPFFKTKVGGILKGVASIVAPNLVNALESVTSVPEALKVIGDSGESEETKIHLRELILREYETEVMDRTSAREREVKVLEAGGDNTLMYVLGWAITLAFLAVVAVTVGFFPLPDNLDRELFYFGAGAVVSAFTMIMSYFFGSSRGSKQKTHLLDD